MPLFGKKETKKDGAGATQAAASPKKAEGAASEAAPAPASPESGGAQGAPKKQPKWNFYCQLAHGSPTGIISSFTNVREMYERIAECYDISWRDILFTTLNTHKVDMEKLLGGQLALDDLIFAHVKGAKKEVEIEKSEAALGLTITDNGCGLAFVKRIKEGSLMDRLKLVEIGDHIEKIDGVSFVDKRHYDVANYLKTIPVGTSFVIRLISPEKSSLSYIGPKSGGKGSTNLSNGKKTVRLRSKGPATEEEMPTDRDEVAIAAINRCVETVLGIDDRELAQSIWEVGKTISNPSEFADALNREFAEFGFSEAFVFDVFGAVQDVRNGRKPAALSGAPSNLNGIVE